MSEAASQRFLRAYRLSGSAAFEAVYVGKVRQSRGALILFSLPNAREYSRWGFSVSRRVGTAPKRNRIKRLMREAIRLDREQLASGLDFVVVVKPHEPMELAVYRELLGKLAGLSAAAWEKRR